MPGLSAALKIIPASLISRSNSEMLQIFTSFLFRKKISPQLSNNNKRMVFR